MSSDPNKKQKTNQNDVVELKCIVQNYAWGQMGTHSEVGKLTSSFQTIKETDPYAELWMGTHVNGPSSLKSNPELSLKKFLEQNPDLVGNGVRNNWNEIGSDIPYLFKVLSIAKALSIQAHPDKKLAEQLHKSQPKLYTDPNHKPEMAIALTPFEALCEFRSLDDIQENIRNFPEFSALLGSESNAFLNLANNSDEKLQQDKLKALFTHMMSSSAQDYETQLKKLVDRLNSKANRSDLENLVLRLEQQYPKDIGVFAVFLLNYLRLQPGEGLFLGANEPHAYLSGNCMECMASSDNVVRSGLTPKFKDIQTLCSMLTYKMGKPHVYKGEPLNHPFHREYRPPIKEFSIDHVSVDFEKNHGVSKVGLRSRSTASIVLCLDAPEGTTLSSNFSGSNLEVKKGSVFLIGADVHCTVDLKNSNQNLNLWRASCNVE